MLLFLKQDSSQDARNSEKIDQDKAKDTTSQPEEASAPKQQSTEATDSATPETNGDEVEGAEKEEAAAGASSKQTLGAKKKEETGVATSVTEPLRLVTCTQSSLVDPIEVHIEERPVHVAEPVLTPIGKFRCLV